MKIKITLIAFFTSALILSSCMKNNVSPGIELVRTAYAALINARAAATTTLANANAALINAQAEVQQSLAALNLAEAQGKLAAAEQIRAKLAADIKTWALALQTAQHTYDVLVANYALAVKAAQNAVIEGYFAKYQAALATQVAIQTAILDQQKLILALSIDVESGKTLTLDSLNARLAVQLANCDALSANYDAAVASLGNVETANAKVAQLQQDSSTLENTLKTLAAEMTTQSRLIDSASYKAKLAAEATAKGKWEAAVEAARPDTALARFLRDTMLYDSIPTFWGKVLADLATAQANLNAKATDTLNSGAAYRAALAVIALGTSDLDAIIASKTDSITKYRDTLLGFIADTVAKNTARLARIADTVQVRTDTALWNAQIEVYHDSADAQRARGADPSVAVADSALAKAQVDYAVAVRIPTTRLAYNASVTALNTSRTTWSTQAGTRTVTARTPVGLSDSWAGTMGVFREGIRARLTATQGLLSGRQTAIANATRDLPDLRSDYLYHQTFIPSLQAAVADALAAKEAARPAYETWRATYFDAYLATKNAAVETALLAYNAAKEATALAKTALMAQAANLEWVRLNGLKTTATANLASVKVLIPLWKNVTAGQDAFLAAFVAAMDNCADGVAITQTNITLAKKAYTERKIDYDKYTLMIAKLQAELTAAQAQVTFWKALLDEAIDAAN